jgi:hypothetical protein
MGIYEMITYVHEHEHLNGNGDTTPVDELTSHYRRRWPVRNGNSDTTPVVMS